MTQKNATPTLAYSYVRFSHPDQAKGDSLRRQTDAAAEWCGRHGVSLDTSTTFRDLGRSAYLGEHRKNPDRHRLAAFLKLVEEGNVPQGSYLLIENLDRLSREHIQPALLLALNLLQAGVRIVQLKPTEMVFDSKSDTLPVMMMMMELSRGHGESAIKSERVGAAWSQRKRRAREEGAIVTLRVPGWVEERGGKLVAIPGRAEIVRHIFDLAINGYGLSLIVKELTADPKAKPPRVGVPTWGRGAAWSKAYVHKILTGRAVLGEYQPIKNGRTDGAVLPNYYPAVIDETTWLQAQAALARRSDKPGRVGHKVPALFSGLLYDAQTKSRMLISWQTRGSGKNRQRRRVLVSADSMEGRTASVSFPAEVFEEAVLSLFKEIRTEEVIGEEPSDETATLASSLAGVEQRQRQIEGQLTAADEDVPGMMRVLRSLEEKRQDLQRQLKKAQQKEVKPQATAWSEIKTLLDVSKDEPSRLRLRDLLRAIVADIWVLIVPRRSHRLAAVQINFKEGAHRDYLIHYRAAGNCRSGGWEARSLRWEGDGKPKKRGQEMDFRNPKDVAALEAALQAVPTATGRQKQ